MNFDAARREAGLLYNVYETGDDSWNRCREILPRINACISQEQARPLLRQILGAYPDSAAITPPFYCDLGSRTFLGERVFVNMDCLFLDTGRIIIHDGVMIGPRCSFYTPVHPMDPDIRQTGLELAKNIVVEENVWLGGSCVINPGVTIGANSVIGSGSVVTRDIPSGVFAAGSPCRVIRTIDENEKAAWKEQYRLYQQARSV